jgi:hypothetical protein
VPPCRSGIETRVTRRMRRLLSVLQDIAIVSAPDRLGDRRRSVRCRD